MEKIFIYGTLAPNRPNEHMLSDIDGSWQEATVKGILYEEGWGAHMGYPGVKLDENSSEVKGLIFSSNELSLKWKELDDFEGKEYNRVITEASLPSGETVSVYIYELNDEEKKI